MRIHPCQVVHSSAGAITRAVPMSNHTLASRRSSSIQRRASRIASSYRFSFSRQLARPSNVEICGLIFVMRIACGMCQRVHIGRCAAITAIPLCTFRSLLRIRRALPVCWRAARCSPWLKIWGHGAALCAVQQRNTGLVLRSGQWRECTGLTTRTATLAIHATCTGPCTSINSRRAVRTIVRALPNTRRVDTNK